MNTQQLADKVGNMMVLLPGNAWTDEEWEERKRVIRKYADRLDAELSSSGLTLEEVGWAVAWDGQWHHDCEPAPPHPQPAAALMIDNEEEQETLFDREEKPSATGERCYLHC